MRQFRVFFLEPKRRPAVESFQTAFQIDPQVFQKRLEQYMTGQLTLPAIEYTLKDRIIVDSQSKPRTLPDAEVQFYLGDLLLHSGRLPEAEPYLKKAIALDPTFAPPQASLGMLRLRQGDRAEALDYLKKAADSDSKSHLVHYYYAQLLSQTAGPQRPNDDQLATMRTELKKTVALSPNFLPAVDLLAYVNLLRNDDLAESATLLRAALMVSPGRDNLSMRLVEVLFRTHEWDEARSLIQRVSRSDSAESALKQRASNLLQAIEFAEIAQKTGSRSSDARLEPPNNDSSPLLGTNDVGPPRLVRRDTPETSSKTGTESNEKSLRRLDPATGTVQIVPGSTEGQILLGLLTSMDCSNGVTLTVQTVSDVVRLHADRFDGIEFVSFRQAIKGDIACGPFPPGLRVRINYRPDASGGMLGVPLIVAFLE